MSLSNSPAASKPAESKSPFPGVSNKMLQRCSWLIEKGLDVGIKKFEKAGKNLQGEDKAEHTRLLSEMKADHAALKSTPKDQKAEKMAELHEKYVGTQDSPGQLVEFGKKMGVSFNFGEGDGEDFDEVSENQEKDEDKNLIAQIVKAIILLFKMLMEFLKKLSGENENKFKVSAGMSGPKPTQKDLEDAEKSSPFVKAADKKIGDTLKSLDGTGLSLEVKQTTPKDQQDIKDLQERYKNPYAQARENALKLTPENTQNLNRDNEMESTRKAHIKPEPPKPK